MPFANGVFTRLRRWVGETNISPVEFDADGDDVALALSTAILRDGTGQPTADIPWNGKKITNLAAPVNAGDALALGLMPGSEVKRALGFNPLQMGNGPGQLNNNISIGWDNTGGRMSVDGTDLGRLWTSINLTAAQVAAILGYTPGRSLIAFQASAGGAGDLPVGSAARSVFASVDFVATGAAVLAVVTASFANQTSGTSGKQANLGCDLFDVTAGSVITTAIEAPVNVSFGAGYSSATAALAVGNVLTPGKTYRVRLYGYKADNAAVIQTSTMSIAGVSA